MDRRELRVVGRLGGPRWGHVLPHPDGFALQSHDNTTLVLADQELTPQWQVHLPPFRGCHAISPDQSRIAVLQRSEVVLLDRSGKRLSTFAHHPWQDDQSGAAAFGVDSAHLWVTIPRTNNVDLALLSLDELHEVETHAMDTVPAGLHPLHHPGGRTIGWSVGEGQDRVLICWSTLVDGTIVYRASAREDRVLTAIHADGAEYLTTPHDIGPIARQRFVDDSVIDELETTDPDFPWDLVAGYYDREHIVAAVEGEDEHQLVLLNRDPMHIEAMLEPAISANRWSDVAFVGAGRIVVTGDEAAEVWQIA